MWYHGIKNFRFSFLYKFYKYTTNEKHSFLEWAMDKRRGFCYNKQEIKQGRIEAVKMFLP